MFCFVFIFRMVKQRHSSFVIMFLLEITLKIRKDLFNFSLPAWGSTPVPYMWWQLFTTIYLPCVCFLRLALTVQPRLGLSLDWSCIHLLSDGASSVYHHSVPRPAPNILSPLCLCSWDVPVFLTFVQLPFRHLDFFEMLRNEDELEFAKRFELVCIPIIILMRCVKS